MTPLHGGLACVECFFCEKTSAVSDFFRIFANYKIEIRLAYPFVSQTDRRILVYYAYRYCRKYRLREDRTD